MKAEEEKGGGCVMGAWVEGAGGKERKEPEKRGQEEGETGGEDKVVDGSPVFHGSDLGGSRTKKDPNHPPDPGCSGEGKEGHVMGEVLQGDERSSGYRERVP
ncbi:hypothetical protein Pcinc_027782 [Petrolisthes cinctipes]|uniref:Uncharacterized protein n=1 Tax=Petrolisthes cinctipes TaxID=88211 RepID=A0AAE1F472_PETCI|nr:hypothetical protein Pcinc_027782 [Petrolisthes cinctipes]